LFAALIHDVKNSGALNSRLEVENDLLYQRYSNKGSYQQRSSFDCALEILEEEFGDLYEESVFGFPTFRKSVKKLVLCTDMESEDKFRSTLSWFDTIIETTFVDEMFSPKQNEAQ
jgi:hypothetical protein